MGPSPPPPPGPIWTPDPVVREHPLNRGLVAWWLPAAPLDGGRQLPDLTGRYPAPIAGSPGATWGTSGPPGGVARPLTFAGFDYATTPVLATPAFTWSAWFRLASDSGGFQTVISAEGGGAYLLLDIFDERLSVYTSDGPIGEHFGFFGLAGGRWYHLAFVRYGDGLATGYRAYLDGVPGSAVASGTLAVTGALVIGYRPAAAQGWVGSLADVAVRDRALSDAEARALYDEARAGYPRMLRRGPASRALPLASPAVSVGFALAGAVADLAPALALSPSAPGSAAGALAATAGPAAAALALAAAGPGSATLTLDATAGPASATLTLDATAAGGASTALGAAVADLAASASLSAAGPGSATLTLDATAGPFAPALTLATGGVGPADLALAATAGPAAAALGPSVTSPPGASGALGAALADLAAALTITPQGPAARSFTLTATAGPIAAALAIGGDLVASLVPTRLSAAVSLVALIDPARTVVTDA